MSNNIFPDGRVETGITTNRWDKIKKNVKEKEPQVKVRIRVRVGLGLELGLEWDVTWHTYFDSNPNPNSNADLNSNPQKNSDSEEEGKDMKNNDINDNDSIPPYRRAPFKTPESPSNPPNPFLTKRSLDSDQSIADVLSKLKNKKQGQVNSSYQREGMFELYSLS
jgi:hypothetical protein